MFTILFPSLTENVKQEFVEMYVKLKRGKKYEFCILKQFRPHLKMWLSVEKECIEELFSFKLNF